MMPEAVPGTDENLRSDAIKIARVICICGIVYTHTMLGGDPGNPWFHQPNLHNGIYWTFVEIFGRSSVPLLSIISGWLVAGSAAKRGYGRFVSNKAETLIAPMVAWNLIALIILSINAIAFGKSTSFHQTAAAVLNEIIPYRDGITINVQNAFLRDVFACMVLAPLLVRLSTRTLVFLLAGSAVWAIGEWQLYILLRPQILLFFTLGVLARRHRLDQTLGQFPMPTVPTVFIAVAALKIWLTLGGYGYTVDHPHVAAAIDNLMRLAAAMMFWRVALYLARGRLRGALLDAEKYVFMLFCSHVLIIKMMGPLLMKLEPMGSLRWFAYFLAQPLILLAIVAIISKVLLRISRRTAGLLSGGRLIQERRPDGAPSAMPVTI